MLSVLGFQLTTQMTFWAVAQMMPVPIDGGGDFEHSTPRAYPIQKVFIPTGFDDNDKAEVIVTGAFPNACWRADRVEVQRTPKGFSLQLLATKWTDFCQEVITEFDEAASLDILASDQYDIEVGNQMMGQLSVRPAKAQTRDEYLYAPVKGLRTKLKFNDEGKLAERYLVIEGEFTTDCQEFMEKPPVDILQPTSDGLVEVLPITELREDADCQTGSFPFEKEVLIPPSVQGRHLFYARTQNGKSFWRLMQVLALDNP